ncbi:MAG: hypothetical protein R3D46_16275 [Defluviimonas denitrificans]
MAGKAYQHLAVHSLFSEAFPVKSRPCPSGAVSFGWTTGNGSSAQAIRAGFYIVLYGQLKLFILTPRGVDKPLHILRAGTVSATSRCCWKSPIT